MGKEVLENITVNTVLLKLQVEYHTVLYTDGLSVRYHPFCLMG